MKYTINKTTQFEKLFRNTFNAHFEDFSKCEPYWKPVEKGLKEIEMIFKSAYNVAINMHDEDKIQYCHINNIKSILEAGHVVYAPYCIYRIKTDDFKCPICGASFTEEQKSISRRDNRTAICCHCGQNEAFDDFIINNG